MTLQHRIWASRIKNLPELDEGHMVGKIVSLGHRIGTVTKEVGDDATGEVYEVEMEDGSIVTASSHEMIITDPAAGTGEPSPDIQAEGTGDGSGSAESKEEDEEDTLDEYTKSDGTHRKVNGGDGRRKGVEKNVEVEETYEDEEETADYDTFFKAALKKFGVEDPGDFKSEEDKKEFFNYVDKNFKGKKEKKESFSADELAHFESVLKKNETLDEAESVPLVRTGQGSYTKDTHPSDAERLYQAKDKREYEKLMSAAEDAMRKGMLAKFGLVGDYKKFTVNVKFKDAKSRKKFEKMNNIK